MCLVSFDDRIFELAPDIHDSSCRDGGGFSGCGVYVGTLLSYLDMCECLVLGWFQCSFYSLEHLFILELAE